MEDRPDRYLAGGRYRIEHVLSRSEGRAVYRVVDLVRGTRLVLKSFANRARPGSRELASGGAPPEQAFAEFSRLSGIDFPGIISVLDCGLDPADGSFYFTTRLVDGSDFLAGLAKAPFEVFLDAAARVLRALEFLHNRGVAHGDIKPQNVLIESRDGKSLPWIIDFGLARSLAAPESAGGSGTLLYMAPEVLEGRSPGPESDLYSLGLMIVQHLYGRLPFDSSSPEASIRDRLEDRLALPPGAPAGVPERVAGVLGRWLKKEPGQRCGTAREALNDLSACARVAMPYVTRESLSGRVQSAEPAALAKAAERILASVGIPDAAPGCAVVFCSQGCASLLAEKLVFAASAAGVRAAAVAQPEGAHGEELTVETFLSALRGSWRREENGGGDSDPLRWDAAALARAVEAGGNPFVLLLLRTTPQAGGPLETMLEELGRLSAGGAVRLAVFIEGDLARAGLIWPSEKEHGAARMAAGVLDRSEAEDFVAELFEWRRVPPALAGLLCPGGAADFDELRNVLVYLTAAGIIDFEMGEFRFHEPRLAGAGAPGLARFMRCAIEGLGAGEGELARVLAIFPDGAPIAQIRDLCAGLDVSGDLKSLQERGLVSLTGGGRAALKSYALRRLLYDGMPPGRRRELHASAARWLGADCERRGPDSEEIAVSDETAVSDEIAFHWARSGIAARSMPALLEAIENAVSASRFGRADSLAAEALETEGFETRPEAFRILVLKGRVAAYLGRIDEAVALFDRAAALATAADPPATACERGSILIEKAKAYVRTGETSKADECYDAILALDLAGTPSGRTLLAQALSFQAYSLYRRHRRIEALQKLEQALPLLDAGEPEILATVHNRLGTVLYSLGRFAAAEEQYRTAIQMFEAAGRGVEARGPLYNLGRILKARGLKSEALERMHSALELARVKDDAYSICTALTGLASTHLDLGDLQESRRCGVEALEVARELGAQRNQAFIFGNLAEVALHEGNPERAEELLAGAEKIWRGLGDEHSIFRISLQRAVRAIRQKSAEEAGEWIRRAGEQAGGDLQGVDALAAARVRAEAAIAFGRLDGAIEALDYELAAAPELADTEAAHVLRLMRVKILAAGGNGIEALAASESLIADLPPGGNPSLCALARIARCRALRALGRPDEQAVREAISQLGRGGNRETLAEGYLELARAIVAGSAGTRSFKRLEDALQVLKEAARLARSAGNGPLLDLVEQEELNIRQSVPGAGREPDYIRRLADMERLQEIMRIINSEMDLKRLLDLIVDVAIDITGAVRGFIILVKSQKFHFAAARHISDADINDPEFEVSHSIARQVATSGRPILTTNAQDDERFRDAASISELKLLSVLCVPLRKKDRLLGSLYIDNPNTIAAFDDYDLQMMNAFATQAGIALGNAELLDLTVERQKELVRSKAEIERLNLELKRTVDDQAEELISIKDFLENKQRELELKYRYDNIVTHAGRMIEVLKILDRITPTDFPVMILGESGTGKELIARSIHYNGPRRRGAFVSVNCAAVVEPLIESELFGYKRGAFTGADRDKAGLFEAADQGTLFLDEIGDMSLEVQKRLLRVLQFGEFMRVGGKDVVKVNVRVISATNKDIHAMVQAGAFREDLFYRLNVAIVRVPPLRERREDIPLLIDHFRKLFARSAGRKEIGFEPKAFEALIRHTWKGNVRELENAVKNLAHLDLPGGRATLKEIGPLIADSESGGEQHRTLKENVETFERARIVEALQMNSGNKTKAAKELGMSLRGLYKKLTKYGL